MLRFFAGALALAFLIPNPAHAASGPLVTGKCWCAIGWRAHIIDCGKRVCSHEFCTKACQATLPRKTSAAPVTDISASRRYGRHAAPRHYARHRYAVRRTYVRHTPNPIAQAAVAGAKLGGIAGTLAGASLANVDTRLVEIMRSAVSILPIGYLARVTSGYRRHDGPHDGHAIDLQIVDSSGHALANRGPDKTGLYERLARAAYGYVLANYPDLRGRFGWGGSFETRAGSGVADIMHYDLMGDRGNHFRPRLAALGPLGLPTMAEGPPIELAKIGGTTAVHRHYAHVRRIARHYGRHRYARG